MFFVVSKRSILITGILEKFLDVGTEVIREHIPATDFGVAERRIVRYCDILVRSEDEGKEIRYFGVILGMSLGNIVEVQEVEENKKKRIEIYDTILGKWYR